VTVDPLGLSSDVDRASDRLYQTAEALDDAAIAGPSGLPGWTRGHVLTHIARNADSLVNLLTWARTGVETPQYPSMADRDAAIAAGAGRPAADHLADLRAAGARFAAAVDAMTPAAWSVRIRYASGAETRAAHVVWSRLREVEVHHVDVNSGYGPGDWSDAFTLRLLHEVAGHFADTGPAMRLAATDLDFTASTGGSSASAGGVAVRGPARLLAAWLTGRAAGDGLTTDPPGSRPSVPAWR
jgi:maleylpyruvate isomerase